MSNFETQETFAQVPGGSIFVRKWKPDAASTNSPIVLLHDSLGSVDQWRDFPKALAQSLKRPVIAYDRLGFGKSSARSGVPSTRFVEEEAEVYFPAICNAMGATRFSLFGHSVGGGMAIMIAAAQSSNCECVITESAQAYVEQRTLDGIRAAKEMFDRPEQFSKLVRWHGDKAQWVLDAWSKTWLSPAFTSWSLESYLSKVQCPALAIHGDMDEFGSTEFPARIANGVQRPSQVAILEKCGHVPHRERQDEVVRLVSSFMAKIHAS
jgi:pimeloyl-ACP methyl ester carboxylesterase